MAFMGNSGGTNLAEAGSLSMEFSALSHLTGEEWCGEGYGEGVKAGVMGKAGWTGVWQRVGGMGVCEDGLWGFGCNFKFEPL